MAVAPFDSRAVDMFRCAICSFVGFSRCRVVYIEPVPPHRKIRVLTHTHTHTIGLSTHIYTPSRQIAKNRVLATKSEKPTHFFPLAMLTAQILPPPAKASQMYK